MNRRFPIILIAAVALFSIGGPAGAQAPQASERTRLVSVVGEGTVHVPPDLATIGAGVVSEAATAGEALAANSTAMRRIIDTLKAQGMEARDLQTSGFSVEPRYSQPPQNYDGSEPFVPKIVGYTVRNDLT